MQVYVFHSFIAVLRFVVKVGRSPNSKKNRDLKFLTKFEAKYKY